MTSDLIQAVVGFYVAGAILVLTVVGMILQGFR